MSDDSTQQRLEEILAICMAELLSEQGLEPRRLTTEYKPQAPPESLTAFCGFGSADFRGAVTIFGSVPLFSRIHPLPEDVSPRDLADWACELVNQAVGRYRNRLLAYNVNLALGVPQGALAENIRLSARLRHTNNPICFAFDDGVLETWLELNLRPGFQLADEPADETAQREGSIVFF